HDWFNAYSDHYFLLNSRTYLHLKHPFCQEIENRVIAFLNQGCRGWDKGLLTKVNCEQYRLRNILRFPRAAGELPRALALRDLTDALPPAGVYVYFLRLYSLLFVFFDNIFVLSQPPFLNTIIPEPSGTT